MRWVRWAENGFFIEGGSSFGAGSEAPELEAVEFAESAVERVTKGFLVVEDRVGVCRRREGEAIEQEGFGFVFMDGEVGQTGLGFGDQSVEGSAEIGSEGGGFDGREGEAGDHSLAGADGVFAGVLGGDALAGGCARTGGGEGVAAVGDGWRRVVSRRWAWW
jgi:hypothetical protein